MPVRKSGDILNIIICVVSVCFLLMFPAYCIEAAKDGLTTALYIVLPSIFPFMVLSRFTVASGIGYSLSELTGKPFEKVFGINRRYSIAFLLGCLGGYPVGSIVLSDMLRKKEISQKYAEHLAGICNNASPMFVIGTVGTILLNNTLYGYVLYAIHLLCVILCGIIMKHIFHPEKTDCFSQNLKHKSNSPLSEAVTSSGINMVNIASYIIVFSVISKFILLLCKKINCSFILCLLEITVGIRYCASSSLPEILKLSTISFALGFSGLCVFSQSKSVFGDLNISFSKYFFAKSLIAVMSFAVSYFIFSIIFLTLN